MLSLRDFRAQLAGGRALLVPWLQDFSLGRTYTPADVAAQISSARTEQTGGFMLWNASGLYTAGRPARRAAAAAARASRAAALGLAAVSALFVHALGYGEGDGDDASDPPANGDPRAEAPARSSTRKERVVADPLSIYLPVVVAEGRGSTLTDVDGNTFIDFAGGVGCLNVGHAHPHVVEAVQEQAARFLHTDFTMVPYEIYVTLAERLLAVAPFSGPAKAAFFNAGTEAVENAVKFARAYTRRPAVIAFEGALPRPHAACRSR